MTMTAEDLIARLGLERHPEGGHFVETYRQRQAAGRGAMTAIYYLLRAGEISAWHRLNDADEIWHHYAGATLELDLSVDGRTVEHRLLGPEVAAGQCPQIVVPTGCWQAARSLGAWTLVGCTVAPAFDFASFELAPPGWQPGDQRDR
ncbi:MAG: cupin domain-containing protein [Alphaproteobacteria bacterium]|nr:cupin [Rhodospirillaceae bacterium]MDP6406904.1 cupin domain-containing protein [Alphaproteobacteria bacterium]MDP6622977.1 cupin domain-containing protein [Alphaproteobacteria bacterium]